MRPKGTEAAALELLLVPSYSGRPVGSGVVADLFEAYGPFVARQQPGAGHESQTLSVNYVLARLPQILLTFSGCNSTLSDHNAPHGVRRQLSQRDVRTAGHPGWKTLWNGEDCLTWAGASQSVHERIRSPGATSSAQGMTRGPAFPKVQRPKDSSERRTRSGFTTEG